MDSFSIFLIGIIIGMVVALCLYMKATNDQEFLAYLKKKKPHLVSTYKRVEDDESVD